MKRLLLWAALLFILSGCGGGSGSSDTKTDQTVSTNEVNTTVLLNHPSLPE